MTEICKHILIQGKVQGVFFRASAHQYARDLGLTGWVRNTAQGDVECMACGNAGAMEKFIDWCNTGPPAAAVEKVLVEDAPQLHFQSFVIRRD
ncbi:MAG: acylphosphatase [Chitinophagales bacterium]